MHLVAYLLFITALEGATSRSRINSDWLMWVLLAGTGLNSLMIIWHADRMDRPLGMADGPPNFPLLGILFCICVVIHFFLMFCGIELWHVLQNIAGC